MAASFALRPGVAIRRGMLIYSMLLAVRGIDQITAGEGLGPKVSPGFRGTIMLPGVLIDRRKETIPRIHRSLA